MADAARRWARWTPREDEVLREHFRDRETHARTSIEAIAKLVGRTASAVWYRAKELRLLGAPPGMESLKAAAARVGVAEETLRKALRRAGKPVVRALSRSRGVRYHHCYVEPIVVDEVMARWTPYEHAARVTPYTMGRRPEHVTVGTIRRRLAARGAVLYDAATVRECAFKGLTLAELGARHGTTRGVVSAALRNAGLALTGVWRYRWIDPHDPRYDDAVRAHLARRRRRRIMKKQVTIEERIAQLRAWDEAYHVLDDPQVTDAEYDEYRDETRKLAPKHPYWSEVGGRPAGAWEKVTHAVPMGSLLKAQSVAELVEWMPPGETLHVSWKLDGISVMLTYEQGKLVRAETRGDGLVGEDVTRNVKRMRGLPTDLSVFTGRVRGEIVVRRSVFEEHLKDAGYKSRRNAAGGIAKSHDGKLCKYLDVMCYGMTGRETKYAELGALRDHGFSVAGPGWLVYDHEQVAELFERAKMDRVVLDFDVDGLVVQVNDNDEREAMGETDLRPHGARALKFPPDVAKTTLRRVEWQVGPSGRVTPVAVFDPVILIDAEVTRASLHNVGNIERLAGGPLRAGDVLVVSRRNDVIPYVESVAHTGRHTQSTPTECPVCRTALEMVGEYLVCPSRVCPAQVTGRICRWLDKIGVKSIGEAVVSSLVEAGLVRGPADLYALTVDHLADLRMSGRKVGLSAAVSMHKHLQEHKELPLHVFVGSLGIDLWGRSMVRLVVDAGYDTLEKLRAARVSQLAQVAGVGEVKAQALECGLADLADEMDALLAAGVKIKAPAQGSLKGKTVCFTGVRDADLERAIEAAGGAVKSSAVKGLTYLVAKDPSGSSAKLTKAREQGTVVVSLDEMRRIAAGGR